MQRACVIYIVCLFLIYGESFVYINIHCTDNEIDICLRLFLKFLTRNGTLPIISKNDNETDLVRASWAVYVISSFPYDEYFIEIEKKTNTHIEFINSL